jgi:hypothetical protein
MTAPKVIIRPRGTRTGTWPGGEPGQVRRAYDEAEQEAGRLQPYPPQGKGDSE